MFPLPMEEPDILLFLELITSDESSGISLETVDAIKVSTSHTSAIVTMRITSTRENRLLNN